MILGTSDMKAHSQRDWRNDYRVNFEDIEEVDEITGNMDDVLHSQQFQLSALKALKDSNDTHTVQNSKTELENFL